MAPLDWKGLMKLDVEEMTNDDEKAEDMYNVIGDFDPGGEEDPSKLRKLFEVTQAIMLIKGTEAQVAQEELDEVAASQGKSTAKRDQENEDLRHELEAMKRDMKDAKRFGPDTSGGRIGDQTRFLRDELNNLESQMSALTKEMKEKDKVLREEKESSERYYKRATEGEQEARELRRENDRLNEDIQDYQRQLESQREALVNRRDDESDSRDKITHKNRILVAALEENKNLVEHNIEQEKQILHLKEEMKEGQREIDQTTERYLHLRQTCDDSEEISNKAVRENQLLQARIDELHDQVRSKADADDEIMAQLNNEVERWRDVLDEKNQHIMDLEAETMRLKDRLTAANMDSEKQSISMLQKAVEEKDKQIEKLRKQLDDASYALDENAALIEDVRSDMMKSGKGPVDRQQQRIVHMQSVLKMHETQLKDSEARAGEAEDDARAKDKELSDALARMRQYEAGEYGLAEAVEEIKEHKQQIKNRDRNIEELTSYINKCELQLNDLYDETEDLRERLGIDRKEPIDLTQYRKKKKVPTATLR